MVVFRFWRQIGLQTVLQFVTKSGYFLRLPLVNTKFNYIQKGNKSLYYFSSLTSRIASLVDPSVRSLINRGGLQKIATVGGVQGLCEGTPAISTWSVTSLA